MNFVAEHRQLLDAARDLAASPRVVEAMGEVARDEMVWADANQDTDAFLAARAIEVPDYLTIRPIPWPDFGKPGPDWYPFTIRLTMCQTVWMRDEDGKLRETEVCRGFEIVPNTVPGGPRG